MNWNRRHFLAGFVLVAILCATYAVYFFFFRTQLQEYADRQRFAGELDKKLAQLETDFEKTQPEIYLAEFARIKQPYIDAVNERAKFFNMGKAFEINQVPEGEWARYFYEKEFKKQLDDLQQYAWTKCRIPNDTFGAFIPDGVSPVTNDEVHGWLRNISHGSTITKMLVDSKAVAVNAVDLWPKRSEYGKQLEMHTVGLDFIMRLNDLGDFLEGLNQSDQYVTVDAISIQNPALVGSPQVPPVRVQMLLSQALYVEPKVTTAGVASATGSAASAKGIMAAGRNRMRGFRGPRGPMGMRGQANVAPPSRLSRILRWLDKYFWPFN